MFRSWGSGPQAVLAEYARRINQALDGLPDDVTVTMHQCRGNREGNVGRRRRLRPRGRGPVQPRSTSRAISWNTTPPRAGTFEPLRFLPPGKVVALGIVSTKGPTLESADHLKRRIDDAARHAPLERLALAPQCGFASSVKGNPLTESDQEAKLARIVEVADAVWTDA